MSQRRGADRFAWELAQAAERSGYAVERIAAELAEPWRPDGAPTERLSFRVADRDAAALRAWAAELDLSPSQLLRRLVAVALERRAQGEG